MITFILVLWIRHTNTAINTEREGTQKWTAGWDLLTDARNHFCKSCVHLHPTSIQGADKEDTET